MYLSERLYDCKLQQFNIDNVILVYVAQLSQVASVQLWETDTEVKVGYKNGLFMSVLYFTSVSLFTISLPSTSCPSRFLKDRAFTVFCIYFS